MPQTFTSPGYFTPGAGQVPLVSKTAIAMHMGHMPGGLPVGTTVKALWGIRQAAQVEWGELALYAGTPLLDTSVLRPIGALDVAQELASAQPGARVHSEIAIEREYAPGQPEDLWLVMVTSAVGGAGAMPPVLDGSWWLDPLEAGLVGVMNGYQQRPSTFLHLSVPPYHAFQAHPASRPFYAVVQI